MSSSKALIRINVILEDILAKAGGKVTMTELLQEKDEFISASMTAVPKELSRRLLRAVKQPPAAAGLPSQKDLPAHLLQPGSSQCSDQGSHP